MPSNQKKVVKVCHLGETKRIKLTEDYTSLVEQTHKAFGEQLPASFKFYYLDEENEMISITSQDDFTEALLIEDLSSLKLTVAGTMMEAKNQLCQQISETQTIRDTLSQSGFFQVPTLSRINSLKPEHEEMPATERVRNIMKSIDSDFEDLEPAIEPAASEKIVTKAVPFEEKIVEQVKVVEAVVKNCPVASNESSEEECMEQEVACWKCNGSKKNKRGRPCKKCDGTGFIQSNELAAIAQSIRQEVRSFCKESFSSMMEDHIKEKKEEQTKVRHAKVECDGCDASPIMGIRYKCTVCADYDLCQSCEAKGIHKEHPMLKIRKPEHAPVGIVCQYRNKIAAQMPDMDHIHKKVNEAMQTMQNPDMDHIHKKINEAMKTMQDGMGTAQDKIQQATELIKQNAMGPAQDKIQQATELIKQQFCDNLNEPIPQAQPKARGFGTKPKEDKKFKKCHVEAPQKAVKIEAPVDPVKLIAQQPISLVDLEESVYPSLNDQVEVDGDKSGNGDPSNSNSEPIVKEVSAFASEETVGQASTSNLSTSITQMITPKYAYYQKVCQLPNADTRKNLQELFEMGFTNFEVNSAMLNKYNNDLQEVSNQLCEQILSESTITSIFK